MRKIAAGDRVWLIVDKGGKATTPWRGKVVEVFPSTDAYYVGGEGAELRAELRAGKFDCARVQRRGLYATERKAWVAYYRRLKGKIDATKAVLDGLMDEMRREVSRRLREALGTPIMGYEVDVRGGRAVVRESQTGLQLAEYQDGELTDGNDHDMARREQLLKFFRWLLASWREGTIEVPLQEETS